MLQKESDNLFNRLLQKSSQIEKKLNKNIFLFSSILFNNFYHYRHNFYEF
jgi:hypothetical protein